MIAILRALGVESYVALTDNDAGYMLPKVAPSPFAFDHAIVVFVVDGRRFWIDPTNYAQGGVFPNIAQPVYGFGLPIKTASGDLWEMKPPQLKAPNKAVREIYDFAHFDSTGLTFRVESEMLGYEADAFRRTLAQSSESKLAQDYLNYYQERHAGVVAVSAPEITDDRDSNRIAVVESYKLDREHYAGKDIEKAFPLRADTVLNLFEHVNLADRTAPIALPYPINNSHTFVIQNGGRNLTAPEQFAVSTDSFSYERDFATNAQSMEISYALATSSPEAPLADIDKYQSVVNDLIDFGNLEFTYGGNGAAFDFAEADMVGLAAFIVIISLVGLVIYLPFGAAARLKNDRNTIDQSVFFPVTIKKFLILNIATLGTYGVFWMWRCWRWVKHHQNAVISPLARAFFSVIFFYPLFGAIRHEQEDGRKAPILAGVLLTLGYIVFSIIGTVAGAMDDVSGAEAFASFLVSALIVFIPVPLVLWVNRLNTAPDINRVHSSWSVHTWLLLAYGVLLWALIFIGAFLSDV